MTDRPRSRRGGSKSRVAAAALALSAGLALVGGMNAAASQTEQADPAPAQTIRRVVVVPETEPLVVIVPSEAPPPRPEPPPPAPPSPLPQPARPAPPVTESGGS